MGLAPHALSSAFGQDRKEKTERLRKLNVQGMQRLPRISGRDSMANPRFSSNGNHSAPEPSRHVFSQCLNSAGLSMDAFGNEEALVVEWLRGRLKRHFVGIREDGRFSRREGTIFDFAGRIRGSPFSGVVATGQ